MKTILTASEIKKRFDSEWVLLGDPQTNEELEVESGVVLCHSKNRDEVYRKVLELRPKHFATMYTGKMPKNSAIVL